MAQMKNHTIKEFIDLLKKENLLTEAECYGKEEALVQNLTYNSKAVTENTLFICKGATFKEEYLKEALNMGGIGYISEKQYDLCEDVPYIIVSDIRKAMPVLANWFFGYAWEEYELVAIGGTKGKSTTTFYTKAIMDDYFKSLGKKETGIISSIEVHDGVISRDSRITTPEAVELHQHFRNAADSGIEFMEMEVSSQGFKHGRLDGVKYDVGVFLNISEDHISPVEHPDFEDYFQSKLMMFERVKTAIVNLETDELDRVLEAAKKAEKLITISTVDENADYYAYDIRKEGHDIVFRAKCAKFDEEFHLTMPGLFNVGNALAAIAIACQYDVPVEYIYSGLKRAKIRGRMEIYPSDDNQVVAIVDFAHNKLSFEKLFESTKKEYPDYEIVCVFGCPGQKAFVRRKYLGTVAGQNADRIILTADDPGNEPVEEICADIAQYIGTCPYEVVLDRTDAIQKAIETAKDKTVILIPGKGQETNQRIGNVYVDYVTDAANAIRFIGEYNERHK